MKRMERHKHRHRSHPVLDALYSVGRMGCKLLFSALRGLLTWLDETKWPERPYRHHADQGLID